MLAGSSTSASSSAMIAQALRQSMASIHPQRASSAAASVLGGARAYNSAFQSSTVSSKYVAKPGSNVSIGPRERIWRRDWKSGEQGEKRRTKQSEAETGEGLWPRDIRLARRRDGGVEQGREKPSALAKHNVSFRCASMPCQQGAESRPDKAYASALLDVTVRLPGAGRSKCGDSQMTRFRRQRQRSYVEEKAYWLRDRLDPFDVD